MVAGCCSFVVNKKMFSGICRPGSARWTGFGFEPGDFSRPDWKFQYLKKHLHGSSLIRVDLNGAADIVEHVSQLIVVGVFHSDPRVCHVAGFHALGRSPLARQVTIADPFTVSLLYFSDP